MTKTELKEIIDTYPDITDTGLGDKTEEQQAAALLVQKYIDAYPVLENDIETTAVILHALGDLTVRDYAMGLTDSDNLDHYAKAWHHLASIAPKEYKSAPAAILSTIVYEKGDTDTALHWLEYTSMNYPLGKLLRRVYAAGWEPKSFAAMRDELHPKVCEAIFGEDN